MATEAFSSEISLIHVHHWAIATVDPVGEAEAFIETTDAHIGFVDANVHGDCTHRLGLVHRCVHRRSPEPLTPAFWSDVTLSEITLEATGPKGGPQAEKGEAVWTLPCDEDD